MKTENPTLFSDELIVHNYYFYSVSKTSSNYVPIKSVAIFNNIDNYGTKKCLQDGKLMRFDTSHGLIVDCYMHPSFETAARER